MLTGLVTCILLAKGAAQGIKPDRSAMDRRTFVDSLNESENATHVDGDKDTGLYWFCKNDSCTTLGIALSPGDDATVQEVLDSLDGSPQLIERFSQHGFRKVLINAKGRLHEYKILVPQAPNISPKGQPAWWRDKEDV